MSSRTISLRASAALLSLVLLGACATNWERADGLGTEPGGEREPLRAVLMPTAGPDDYVSPPVDSEDEIVEGRWRHVAGPFQRPARVAVVEKPAAESQPIATPRATPQPQLVRRTKPRLAVPPAARVRTPAAPAPSRSRTPGRAPRAPEPPPDARTHYLRNPTTIEAAAITLRVPREWLGEVRGEGGKRTEGPNGAWRLTGKATVRLRELTLRGSRLTVIPLSKPDASLSIMAKGNVDMVSRVGDRAIREEGANMIMITNARMVPLR